MYMQEFKYCTCTKEIDWREKSNFWLTINTSRAKYLEIHHISYQIMVKKADKFYFSDSELYH